MKSYRIATIPGDGIGIEVVEAALQVLQAAAKSGGYSIESSHLPWGTARYKSTGSYLPPDFIATLKQHDAILFGAVGMPGERLLQSCHIWAITKVWSLTTIP